MGNPTVVDKQARPTRHEYALQLTCAILQNRDMSYMSPEEAAQAAIEQLRAVEEALQLRPRVRPPAG